MLLPAIGEEGQRRLIKAHALVVGCGALGCAIIDSLARAGVGRLTIIDRDLVEITNLQRQTLFDEDDAEQGAPKAEAAKARVARINSQVTVLACVDDLNPRNAESFVDGVDIILDGLDNFESRYLLNDLAVKHGLPYIYGGAVAASGASMAILPHHGHRSGSARSAVRWTEDQSTPCLRCVFPEAPPPGASPTCDTAGVLGPIVAMVAAHQSAQTIKLLTGCIDSLDRSLLSIDAWSNETRRIDVSGARAAADCPCCGEGDFEFLRGDAVSATTSLCGRNAVQITPAGDPGDFNLAAVRERLASHGEFTCNAFLLRGTFSSERGQEDAPLELTLFPNGRAILKGVTEPETARSIYAKYIGA